MQNRASLNQRFQKIQHPAPGAPAPRHLDSRIAKHGFRRYAGPGTYPAPENE